MALWRVAAGLISGAAAAIAGAVDCLGLVLSSTIGALLAVTGWYGGELSYRHLVGVDPR